MSELATKDLVETTVYKKNGVTYVPHYRNLSVFVGPGYPKFTLARYDENDLIDAGAKRHTMILWPRSLYGIVSKENP